MVETTPTLGSIESTTQGKRALAQQSLRFNLDDQTFCSLFPETAGYIREQLTPKRSSGRRRSEEVREEKEDERENEASEPDVDRGTDGGGGGGEEGGRNILNGEENQNEVKNNREELPVAEAVGFINGHVVNICVFLGVAAFALTVKCVLASTR